TSVTANQTTYNDASAPDAWIRKEVSLAIAAVSGIRIERDTAGFDPQNIEAEEISPAALGLTFDLTATTADPVVPGSVMLTVCGKQYVDRAGVLLTDVAVDTGAGTPSGTIDYTAGRATLTW